MVWYFNTNSSNIVSYPVVWEPTKEPSNVVDYNIREEQTIDQSSVFTANNQTTTGMATQIPWINCPKLIASTSIIWDLWWWWLATSILTASTEMTQWAQTSLKNYTLTWDWDIYLDEDRPARIYCKWWTYLIAIDSYTTNSNASIDATLFKYSSGGTQTAVLRFNQSGWTSQRTTHLAVATIEKWWHVRLYVTLWITATYYWNITFIKLS